MIFMWMVIWRKDQSWVRLTNTKGSRVCPGMENQECTLTQTSRGKRLLQHGKLDGSRKAKETGLEVMKRLSRLMPESLSFL